MEEPDIKVPNSRLNNVLQDTTPRKIAVDLLGKDFNSSIYISNLKINHYITYNAKYQDGYPNSSVEID